jgi:hypothetical protein
MLIVARRIEVERMERELQRIGEGWNQEFLDPAGGGRWRRHYLGAEGHGGGVPVLVRQPEPTAAELLEQVRSSSDEAEIAASAWLLCERDKAGESKDALILLAEAAAAEGDRTRVTLVVGWGDLLNEANLRPFIGKDPAIVSQDHDHFRGIAARARNLLHLGIDDPLLRDLGVFAQQ